MKNKNLFGLLLILSASLILSIGGLFIKLIPWNGLSIGSGRCFFSSLIIFIYIKLIKHKIVINKASILGAICMCLTLTLCVCASKLTTAANAIVLQYTAPVFVVLIEFFVFNKKPSPKVIITILGVFVGISIVFIDGLRLGNAFGNLLALLSGISYSVVCFLNSFKDGDALSSVFLGHLMSALVGVPFLLKETVVNNQIIFYVVILGVLQLGLGYILFTCGLKYTSPLNASIVSAVEPIMNPVLVAVFYHEIMTLNSLVGCFIVIVSIVVYFFVSKINI